MLCGRSAGMESLDDLALGRAHALRRSTRRDHWLAAAGDATRDLLADNETSPWLISARAARRAAGTSAAAVWLSPAAEVEDAGLRLGAFDGLSPDEATVTRMASRALYEGICTRREPVLLQEPRISRAVLMIPLLACDEVLGALTLPCEQGDGAPSPDEQLMITAFCGQTALACQLAQAQRELRRIAIYADRDRIARNLHDQVIQQLFGAGLILQSLDQLIEGEPAKRVRDVVERLDHTIAEIRRSIFSLHVS
jgi:signal transduction histidine kinase